MPISKEQEALKGAISQLFRDDPSTHLHLMNHDKVRVISNLMVLLSEKCWLKTDIPIPAPPTALLKVGWRPVLPIEVRYGEKNPKR